jgi:hypothetical protein
LTREKVDKNILLSMNKNSLLRENSVSRNFSVSP